jgi:hypothetical protein
MFRDGGFRERQGLPGSQLSFQDFDTLPGHAKLSAHRNSQNRRDHMLTGLAGNAGKQRTWKCAGIEANWYAPGKWKNVSDFRVAAILSWFGCLV